MNRSLLEQPFTPDQIKKREGRAGKSLSYLEGHAVIQRLKPKGAEIHVVTSDNGLWYFQGCSEVASLSELAALYYARRDGKISIAATVASIADFRRIMRQNARHLTERMTELRPALIVTDSQYTFRFARRLGIPQIALNNSDVVVAGYRRFRPAPRSIRAQFYIVEFSDYLFHRAVPDLVVSPTLDPTIPLLGGPFVRVGPIVREGFVGKVRHAPPRKVTIMLSGSAFGSQVSLSRLDYPVSIDVIGRDAPPGWQARPGITWHGKISDTRPFLADTDLAIVNGGFSAVSEAFCMRTPMVVVPVPRHAEQWINARTIEALGVGMMSSESNIESTMFHALDRLEKLRSGYARIDTIPDGAQHAADLIWAMSTRARPL